MKTTIFYPSGATITLPIRALAPEREPFLAIHIEDQFAVPGVIALPTYSRVNFFGQKVRGGDVVLFDPRAIIIGFPEQHEKPIATLGELLVLRYNPNHFADEETVSGPEQYDPRHYVQFPLGMKQWMQQNPQWDSASKLMEISNDIKQRNMN